MVDALEPFYEHLLGLVDVVEGDGTCAEVALGHLSVDDAVHQLRDALFGVFVERARGRFHGIGHHQNGLFACEGVGTRIAERGLVDNLVGVFVLVFDVEVAGEPLPVVGEYKLFDDVGKVVLFGDVHSFGNMADNNACTLLVRHVVVWVVPCLVLGEENRVGHLSNVVIERSCAHQQTVRLYAVGNFGCQVAHGDGMLEGARCHFAQVAQQAFVGVGEFEEGNV